jgi:hypothetical protein
MRPTTNPAPRTFEKEISVKMTLTELEALVVEQGRRLALAESDIFALKSNQGFRKVRPIEVNPPTAEPEGARIIHPVESAKIALPNAEELRKLLEIVFGTYPTLRPWTPGSRSAFADEQVFTEEFSAAFIFVANQGRAAKLDKKSICRWADEAGDWWRQRNNRKNVGGGAFLAACIAAGDVEFQRSDHFGNVWAVALATFGGRPATEAWRNVLRGEIRRPIPGVHKPPSGEGFSVRVGQSVD